MECEVHVDGVRLEHVSEFIYLGYVLDEAGTDGEECSSRKVASGRRVVDAIRSLVNARDLSGLVLHEKIACTCSHERQCDNVMEGEGEI